MSLIHMSSDDLGHILIHIYIRFNTIGSRFGIMYVDSKVFFAWHITKQSMELLQYMNLLVVVNDAAMMDDYSKPKIFNDYNVVISHNVECDYRNTSNLQIYNRTVFDKAWNLFDQPLMASYMRHG